MTHNSGLECVAEPQCRGQEVRVSREDDVWGREGEDGRWGGAESSQTAGD